MNIFVLRLSEDGIFHNCFSNKKALYKGIIDTGYNITRISLLKQNKTVIFSYTNLVKYFDNIYELQNETGSTIEIYDLTLIRK